MVDYNPFKVVESVDDIVRRPSAAAQERAEYIRQKQSGGCDLCGSAFRLAFYHKDPTTKEFNPQTCGIRISLDALEVELAKCVVICVSCRMRVQGNHRPPAKIHNKDLFWELKSAWEASKPTELPKRSKKTPKRPN